MRRTTGILASLTVIVAFLAGIAIGLMSGGSSGPSAGTNGVTLAITSPPVATLEVAPPSPDILSSLMPGSTPEHFATPSPESATPQSSPEPGTQDRFATPGTSPIDTLKP